MWKLGGGLGALDRLIQQLLEIEAWHCIVSRSFEKRRHRIRD